MKRLVIFIFLVYSVMAVGRHKEQVKLYADLPLNPQSGKCYIRCLADDRGKSIWEDVNCALLYMHSLALTFEGAGGTLSAKDKRILERTFKKLIKENVSIQLESHYKEARTVGQNMAIAKGRSILVGNYLVTLGLNPNFLKVQVAGASQKEQGIKFRDINNNPDGYHYDAAKGF